MSLQFPFNKNAKNWDRLCIIFLPKQLCKQREALSKIISNSSKYEKYVYVPITLLINILRSRLCRYKHTWEFADVKPRKLKFIELCDGPLLQIIDQWENLDGWLFLWLPEEFTEWMDRQFALPFLYLSGTILTDPFFV